MSAATRTSTRRKPRAASRIRGLYCEQCNYVGDWRLVKEHRNLYGQIEVYQCPKCGHQREYVVGG